MERRKKRENLQYSAHCMFYAYAPICTNAVQWYIHAAWLQDMRMIFTDWTPKIIKIKYVRRLFRLLSKLLVWSFQKINTSFSRIKVGNLKIFTLFCRFIFERLILTVQPVSFTYISKLFITWLHHGNHLRWWVWNTPRKDDLYRALLVTNSVALHSTIDAYSVLK